MTQVAIDRAVLEELITLLRAHEAAAPPSLRAMACNDNIRFLPTRAYLVRDTIRIRQHLEGLRDDVRPRPTPGRLAIG